MCMRMLIYLEDVMTKFKNYFTLGEKILWSISVISILLSFFLFDHTNYLTLAASLIGVTSLIFCAKGNPFGQLLMVIFSILYGLISYSFAYYGEVATYVGMTLPMSILALISWVKNPYEKNKAEVKVNVLRKKEVVLMWIYALLITVLFYFILDFWGTANLIPGTVSVTTSFLAVYLSFYRSPYFALAYAANDIVLIVLWVLASMQDYRYLSVVVCFAAFLANDIYGFIYWQKMKAGQNKKIIN
ncbi:MAG: nicotinamide mononucleotide transporter [Lachnospiraceae bacterium]|nr:nicotinamide mononucleotide transporter [Lachnospiraceae bacterium]